MSAARLPALRVPREYDALYIAHSEIRDIQMGSVVFIGPPGYSGQGVYSIPFEDCHRGELRRIIWAPGDRYQTRMDTWPTEHGQWFTKEQFQKLAPRRVCGVVKAITPEFHEFLITRTPRFA
jgi:hypothetical protein